MVLVAVTSGFGYVAQLSGDGNTVVVGDNGDYLLVYTWTKTLYKWVATLGGPSLKNKYPWTKFSMAIAMDDSANYIASIPACDKGVNEGHNRLFVFQKVTNPFGYKLMCRMESILPDGNAILDFNPREHACTALAALAVRKGVGFLC